MVRTSSRQAIEHEKETANFILLTCGLGAIMVTSPCRFWLKACMSHQEIWIATVSYYQPLFLQSLISYASETCCLNLWGLKRVDPRIACTIFKTIAKHPVYHLQTCCAFWPPQECGGFTSVMDTYPTLLYTMYSTLR